MGGPNKHWGGGLQKKSKINKQGDVYLAHKNTDWGDIIYHA